MLTSPQLWHMIIARRIKLVELEAQCQSKDVLDAGDNTDPREQPGSVWHCKWRPDAHLLVAEASDLGDLDQERVSTRTISDILGFTMRLSSGSSDQNATPPNPCAASNGDSPLPHTHIHNSVRLSPLFTLTLGGLLLSGRPHASNAAHKCTNARMLTTSQHIRWVWAGRWLADQRSMTARRGSASGIRRQRCSRDLRRAWASSYSGLNVTSSRMSCSAM